MESGRVVGDSGKILNGLPTEDALTGFLSERCGRVVIGTKKIFIRQN